MSRDEGSEGTTKFMEVKENGSKSVTNAASDEELSGKAEEELVKSSFRAGASITARRPMTSRRYKFNASGVSVKEEVKDCNNTSFSTIHRKKVPKIIGTRKDSKTVRVSLKDADTT